MSVFFKFYVMNFVNFVFNCYSHIASHVSQAFASFTYYTSYSLNIVHVIVCVFGLTNRVCKYFEFLCKTDFMLENLWRMFENLNFGKTGLKTCVFEKLCISYSCILFIFFNAWRSLCTKLGCFSKLFFFSEFWSIEAVFRLIEIVLKILREPLSISINQNWFSINRKSWIRFFKN